MKIPSGAEARIHFAVVMYGLKPVPFKLIQCAGIWLIQCEGIWLIQCEGVWLIQCEGVWLIQCEGIWLIQCEGIWLIQCEGILGSGTGHERRRRRSKWGAVGRRVEAVRIEEQKKFASDGWIDFGFTGKYIPVRALPCRAVHQSSSLPRRLEHRLPVRTPSLLIAGWAVHRSPGPGRPRDRR